MAVSDQLPIGDDYEPPRWCVKDAPRGCQGRPAFSDRQIWDEAIALLTAGYETAAVALTETTPFAQHLTVAKRPKEGVMIAFNERAANASRTSFGSLYR